MRRAVWSATVLGLLLTACPLHAQQPLTVLVDGSGSMTGFLATGATRRLVEKLSALGADRSYAFTYTATPDGAVRGGLAPFTVEPSTPGNVTLLWRGLQAYLDDARDGELIAMVTDNVQDPGAAASEARDVRQFYTALAGSARLPIVYVIPLRLPFDGILYGRAGALGRYRDLRGLVVYLIAVQPADAAKVRARAEQIARSLGGAPVRMQPYDKAPVTAVIDTAETRLVSGESASSCPTVPLGPDPRTPGVLVARRTVRQGTPFGAVFVVRLQSQMEGVTLARPTFSAAITDDFGFPEFVAAGSPEVIPTPPRLETDLEPGDSTSIRVRVCFSNGVRFAKNQRFSTAGRRGGEYEGEVTVGLNVPRADLRLAEDVRNEFSVLDPSFFSSLEPALHRRVYGLEYAFRSLAPDDVQIEHTVQGRLRFAVQLPLGPLVWLLARIAGLVALLAGGLWLLLRSHAYRLVAEGAGAYRLSPVRRSRGRARPATRDPFDGWAGSGSDLPSDEGRVVQVSIRNGYPLTDGGTTVARLRYVPLRGPAVAAAAGFLIDGERRRRQLPASGGRFTVGRAGTSPPPARESRREQPRPARSSSTLDPTDLFR